jgi:DNA primase
VGFSGRIVEGISAMGGKYINTRDTIIYHKRDQIFGLHVTKEAIRKQNQVLLVEGEFDVMSCFQNGVSNVAAVKGTALTEQQVRLLSRYAEKITFCFDGDTAGQEAIKRSLAVVAKRGVAATVVVIPSGKDPDESLRTSPIEFKEAVKHDLNVYDYLFEQVLKKYDSSTSEGKQHIAEEFLPFVNEIENAIVREHYIKKLSAAIQITSESITQELERIQKKLPPVPKESVTLKEKPREEKVEEYLLALILQSAKPHSVFTKAWNIIGEYTEKKRASQKLFHYLNQFQNDDQMTADVLAKIIPAELSEAYSIAILFPLSQFSDENVLEMEVTKTALQIRKLRIKEKIKELGEEINSKEAEGNTIELEKLQQIYSQYIGMLRDD